MSTPHVDEYDDYSDITDEFGDFYDGPDEMDKFESLLAECGWFDETEPWCLMAGTEFCDFECPMRRSRRREAVYWRARQRRKRGRGIGPDPRRFGFRAAWAIHRRCRLRRERKQYPELYPERTDP
jgi:hypothetical protein